MSATANKEATRINAHLRLIYKFTTLLSIFMILWILLLPGTAFHSSNTNWRDKIRSKMSSEYVPLPKALNTKYQNQTSVQLTHILPAVIWVACIPFQFHKGFRKDYKTLHRIMGRVFMYDSFIIMFGFGLIVYKKLTFEHYLDVELVKLPNLDITVTDFCLGLVMLAFVGCAVKAVSAAKQKKFMEHQYWMIRHVALGLWVSLQRVMIFGFVTVWMVFYKGTIATDEFKGKVFGNTGFAAMTICMALGEYTIRLLKMQQNNMVMKKV